MNIGLWHDHVFNYRSTTYQTIMFTQLHYQQKGKWDRIATVNELPCKLVTNACIDDPNQNDYICTDYRFLQFA